MNVGIQRGNELFYGNMGPILSVKSFHLQPAEKTFTGGVVGRAAFAETIQSFVETSRVM